MQSNHQLKQITSNNNDDLPPSVVQISFNSSPSLYGPMSPFNSLPSISVIVVSSGGTNLIIKIYSINQFTIFIYK